jgi:hypothetical protein
MKNIQVIDRALDAVYDIFAATEQEFALIFPKNADSVVSKFEWLRTRVLFCAGYQ